MNILLINHHAGSPELGMEYRPFYLAREWISLGHSVTIAAASFSHVRRENPKLVAPVAEDERSGIRYVWLKTRRYTGNGTGRLINMIGFISGLYRYRKHLVAGSVPDIIIASSTYPLDIYPAGSLAAKYRSRLVFEVHDLWPLSPIELGNMSRRHPFITVIQRAEDRAFRKADRVISILPKARGYMESRGMEPRKFFHIPNGIDVEEWQKKTVEVPDTHKKILERLRSNDQFIVGYTGAHGVANALHTLLEAAEIIKDDSVTFVLVGNGPEKSSLEESKVGKKLNNVVFLPLVSRAAVPALMEKMDVLYLGLRNEPLFRFGISPNKLIDYMMAAKPVIFAVEAGNNPVAECGCGVSVAAENPVAVVEAVTKLKNKGKKQLKSMGEKGRQYVLQNNDYRILAKRFLDAAMADIS